ncbi:MAG: hypothetical protein IJN44_03960, partial [Clostridia bacterium]|nr:hypothetical protein [Clostridia bacterium]
MAYYQDFTKKKMTRKDHLRQDSTWEEEGTRYRKAAKQNDQQRFEKNDKRSFSGKPGHGGKPANQKMDFHQKPSSFAPPAKPQRPAPAPRPVEKDDAFLPPENLLSGRNPIREAIKNGRDIEKLLVAKGDLSATAKEIISMARDAHIPIQTVERTRLDEITKNHQGMLAFASAYRYFDVEDMLSEAEEKGEEPFLVILDGVTDPQNLGAIIRTAA